jgi:hypothetical protein
VSLLVFGFMTSLFFGTAFNRIADRSLITFQTGDLGVMMAVDSPRVVDNDLLASDNGTIRGFTGVYRPIQYRLISRNLPLPPNLRVKETLDVVQQSDFPDFDFIGERERTVSVGTDGTFSDLLALGTTDGTVFPPDFRQIVRQRVYLIDDKDYKAGRLLAVVAIERRRANILIRLIWPSIKDLIYQLTGNPVTKLRQRRKCRTLREKPRSIAVPLFWNYCCQTGE